MKEHVYFVKGMHCASCELLIEKKLLKIEGIKSVEASAVKGQVTIEREGSSLTKERLNSIFEKDGYVFFEQPIKEKAEPRSVLKNMAVVGIIIVLFLFLNYKLGLSSWLNVSSRSSLIAFFFLGILAGLSSCAALVGGLILSMSKQWLGLYQVKDSTYQKLQPHFMFNAGRLLSYGFFGAILGILGAKLQISFGFTSFLVIIVSILMLFLGLQMLGVKAFRRFQITMPKFITRYVADESKFQGRYMPFVLGASTFFLPCGFTITAQGLALLSGNALQGGLIMFLFALGTAPALLAIGFSSVKFSTKPHLANKFLQVAGALVLFFAFFNLNSQLNVLGLPSLNNVLVKATNNSTSVTQNSEDKDLPPIINGKQVVKMDASSRGYTPNYFKVRAGVPVRWEITDRGTSGCTNAIISRSLFDGEIPLTPGKTSIKEFTPQKTGKYKFSCWMGMISGTIEVINPDSSTNVSTTALNNSNGNNDAIIPSGAKGCSCGGGGRNGSCGAKN